MYMMSSHCIAVALLLLGLYLTAYSHSGLYGVNTTKFSKDFSASWLISRSRFVGAEPTISTAVSMASATFSTIRQRCHNCQTLVTRDFFDFMVEHLSSATNQLPNADEQLFEEAIRRLQVTANSIKSLGPSNEKDPRVEQTIGLLVYSSICFSKHTQLIQRSVRPAFFVATFWSVHRYFKDIVIYVASQEDEDAVNAMDLPYKLLTRLQTPFDDKNRTSLLPRDSMLDLLYNMKNDEPFYKKYQYVFFSEGDQILHMREAGVMYDTIDNSGGTFITVPHRMQSLTLMQDFPEKYHHKWKNLPAQNIPDAQVVVQALHETKGSCCQNGDVEVAPCTGWWYQCPTYGIRDFKTWLKFGESGLTMPPVTEHKATCQYFPERTQCPLPKTCNARVPTRSLPHTPLTERDLCTEIVDTRYLGYGLPSVMPPAPVAATPAPKSPGVRVSVTQQQMQQQQPSSVLRDMAKPQPRPLGVNRAELLSPGERMQQSQQYLRQQQYLQQQQHLQQQQQRRQHLEPVVVEPPRKPETRPNVMRPSATATTASSSAVVDMSDMGAFDTSNLDSIGENDNSIINNNYRTTDPIKSRRRKNRLRRRNRRIDTVTITANNNNNKQGAEGGGAGIAGNGRSGKTSAAGLRVTTIDDIQLA